MPIPLMAGLAIGSGILGAFSGNKKAKKAEQLQQRALDMADREYSGRQPFRDAAATLLARKVNPDAITRMYADEGNPYAQNNAYEDPWMPDAAPAPTPSAAQQQAADLRARVASSTRTGKVGRMMNSVELKMADQMERPGAPLATPAPIGQTAMGAPQTSDARLRLIEAAKRFGPVRARGVL